MATMGRPTKLTPEILEKAKAYVNGGYLVDELVPTVAGLSLNIDIRRSTVYEWAKENKDFSDIVEKVMASQEHGLIKGALGGDYNSTIAKLLLTKHGYSDKQDTQLSGPGGSPIQIQEVKLTIVDPSN
jgi:hypothetical protein